MTTIAYRDGVLAGDGRVTIQNDEHASPMVVTDSDVKVWKLPDGRLFGAAHGSEDIERLRRALVKGSKPPKLDDVAGLLIDRTGRAWLYEGRIWQPVNAPYYAVGTGSIFAMGAMDAGALAVEACAIGARRDPYSGGTITSVCLGRKRK
jgi:hypothetical protein